MWIDLEVIRAREGRHALGDATRQAKLATTDLDVRRTWILFGDPTMKIR